jgi:hypothetical protein
LKHLWRNYLSSSSSSCCYNSNNNHNNRGGVAKNEKEKYVRKKKLEVNVEKSERDSEKGKQGSGMCMENRREKVRRRIEKENDDVREHG